MVRAILNHKAFTLIELLFAIMIMGITMVAVPVIMSSNNKGFDSIIIQEAIFAASAELNQVLSYRWDENSIENDAGLTSFRLAGVIETGDCNNTSSSDRFRLRPGHVSQPLHRRCENNATGIPSALASFGNIDNGEVDLDDIDDINRTIKSLFLNTTGTSQGYKDAYTSEFNITYEAIGTIAQASHDAKRIEIIVKDSSGNVVTRLRAFTLNIGEVDFYKRTY